MKCVVTAELVKHERVLAFRDYKRYSLDESRDFIHDSNTTPGQLHLFI